MPSDTYQTVKKAKNHIAYFYDSIFSKINIELSKGCNRLYIFVDRQSFQQYT